MQNLQLVKVLKIGSSIGITIPAHVAKGLLIERGDQMALAVYHEGAIMLRKVSEEEILQLKPPNIENE